MSEFDSRFDADRAEAAFDDEEGVEEAFEDEAYDELDDVDGVNDERAEDAEAEAASAFENEAAVQSAPASPIAAALAELDTLSERELAEHPDVYQRIHGELQDSLSAIDDA